MARTRIVLVVAQMTAGAAVGYGVAQSQSTLYASTSTLMAVPPRVPDHLVRASVRSIDATQVTRLRQLMLTRTRLGRIIEEMALYEEESRTLTDDALVDLMRERIVIQLDQTTVRVGFIHADPQLAMRVAERLASMMVEESLRDREMQSENANQFMKSQMDEIRSRLNAAQAALVAQRRQGAVPRSIEVDVDVLEARYRELFRMSDEARVAANLERRQIGEQFRIIDAARVPQQPLPQGRHRSTAIGAGIGLLAGLGIAFRRPRG